MKMKTVVALLALTLLGGCTLRVGAYNRSYSTTEFSLLDTQVDPSKCLKK